MMRVFLDASVLFAASYSATGASREILRYGVRGYVTLIVSSFIIREVGESLHKKAPDAVTAFQQFVQAVPFE